MSRIIIMSFILLTLQGCTANPSSNKTKPTLTELILRNMHSALTPPRASNNTGTRVYRCDELTQQQAYYLYRNGHKYLDRDKDGQPCER